MPSMMKIISMDYIKQSHLYVAAIKELPEFKEFTLKKSIIHFVLGDYQHVVEINDEYIKEELNGLDEVAVRIHENNFSKNFDECGTCSYRIFCKK